MSILLFLSDSFGIETINTFIHSCNPRKPYPTADKNGQNLPLFRTEAAQKPYPYMAFIGKNPPPPPHRALIGAENVCDKLITPKFIINYYHYRYHHY